MSSQPVLDALNVVEGEGGQCPQTRERPTPERNRTSDRSRRDRGFLDRRQLVPTAPWWVFNRCAQAAYPVARYCRGSLTNRDARSKAALVGIPISATSSPMGRASAEEDLLDNAVWHALHGPLSRFASSDSTADFVRFDREIGFFGAVDQFHEATWTRIAEVVGSDGFCMLVRDLIPSPPPGWEEVFQGQCWQMVAGEIDKPRGLEVLPLGPDDGPEMLALVELTEPAPFVLRTPELGRFVGIRRGNQLVAMAGERLRVPGFVEISAVCTHPDVRGEGLASELTLNVAHSIRAGGDEACLHVLDDNHNAYRLYQKLGFVVRRKVDVLFARWHGPDWRPSD